MAIPNQNPVMLCFWEVKIQHCVFSPRALVTFQECGGEGQFPLPMHGPPVILYLRTWNKSREGDSYWVGAAL